MCRQVLACFDAYWPVLNIAVAYFGARSLKAVSKAIAAASALVSIVMKSMLKNPSQYLTGVPRRS
jgi:hypothetical protein